jgi:hypothetical protein
MKHRIGKKKLRLQRIHIYSKRVNTSNIIHWGTFQYFKKHVAKKILQKILSIKKS